MTPDNRHTLFLELQRDEGVRSKPYRDTVGKLTIGIGRNLDDVGLRPDEIEHLCQNDIQLVMDGLDLALPWWRQLDEVRQRVLVNMGFNLGLAGLLGFKNTLHAVRESRYADAAEGMLASKWAKQVGDRAKRLASMMATGKVDG